MIADGKPVYAVPLAEQERRLDVGNFNSYGRAFVRALLDDTRYGADFAGYLKALAAHLEDADAPDPDAM